MDSFRKHITESTIPELYDSTVAAFPRTTMRQHATQPIVIKNLHWTPYKGVKTLFVKGLAQNEGREYNPIILFKGVKYDEGSVKLMASDGKEYRFAPMNLSETEVVVRCNCPDFHWRFNYYNHLDKSLYGRHRAKYESKGDRGPANPMEMPGMCKHCLKLAEVLRQAGVFQQ